MSKIKPKSNYDFPIKTISNLSEITYTTEEKTHYHYMKDAKTQLHFDFLYKRNNNPKKKKH